METQDFKYEGRIHTRPNSNDPKFIGTVYANSIKDLKEKARAHARNWNEHGGRLYIQCQNTEREWIINS
jgi:hypothetical protein